MKPLAVLALLLVSGSVFAQTARDGGGDARLQALVQQLTAERGRLESENAALQRRVDETAAALAEAQAALGAAQSELAETRDSLRSTGVANDRNAQLVEQLRARMEEIVAEFRQTIDVLRSTEAERNDLAGRLATTEGERDRCITNNLELYRTGIEVLDQYEEKGCFEAVRQRRDPFLQLKRVEIENLVDEYRWRLEDELLQDNLDSARQPDE